jgi:hypothetical protein
MTIPSVRITEESILAPSVVQATGRVAYVVQSERGKYDEYMYPESEADLVTLIGEPTTLKNSKDFHICKSFFDYGNDLVLVRALDLDTAEQPRLRFDWSATGGPGINMTDSGETKFITDPEGYTIAAGDLEFFAKEAFDTSKVGTLEVAISKYESSTGEPTWQDNTDEVISGGVKFSDVFEFGPDSVKSEIAISVIFNGTIVENFIVSLEAGNFNDAGENNYITDYLESKSDYINGFASSTAYDNVESITATDLEDGTAGDDPSSGDFETAYSKFLSKNDITFDYIIDGTHDANRAYIISLVESRKDCLGFLSPAESTIFANNVPLSNTSTIIDNIVADRLTLSNTSWSSMAGNWKQVYDKYRDKNIWIPVVGDNVGTKVRSNTDFDPWWDATGNTRGVIRTVIKLAFNPTVNQSNTLYKNGVNHVVFKPGKGFIIDGQKTMYDKNVGVSRINIRDLFRIMETYVADVADDFLHEFNDEVARARFESAITPFFKDIQDRRGIQDFLIDVKPVELPYRMDVDIKVKGNTTLEDIVIKFFDVPLGVSFEEA